MYHILVCDDEKDIVSVLEIYLKSEGYEVYKACYTKYHYRKRFVQSSADFPFGIIGKDKKDAVHQPMNGLLQVPQVS